MENKQALTQIHQLIEKLVIRKGQLYHNHLQYKDEERYHEAMICDVKIGQINIFIKSLSEILNGA